MLLSGGIIKTIILIFFIFIPPSGGFFISVYLQSRKRLIRFLNDRQ